LLVVVLCRDVAEQGKLALRLHREGRALVLPGNRTGGWVMGAACLVITVCTTPLEQEALADRLRREGRKVLVWHNTRASAPRLTGTPATRLAKRQAAIAADREASQPK
jgi:hypothetical protein